MNKQIFMGNGDHSSAQCYELHRELERALDILGGIQQPVDPTLDIKYEQCIKLDNEYLDGQDEVTVIAKKLYLALTGRHVILSEIDFEG